MQTDVSVTFRFELNSEHKSESQGLEGLGLLGILEGPDEMYGIMTCTVLNIICEKMRSLHVPDFLIRYLARFRLGGVTNFSHELILST